MSDLQPRRSDLYTVRTAGQLVVIDADYFPLIPVAPATLAISVAFHAARRVIATGRRSGFWFITGGPVAVPAAGKNPARRDRFLDEVQDRRITQQQPQGLFVIRAPKADTEHVEAAMRGLPIGDLAPALRYLDLDVSRP